MTLLRRFFLLTLVFLLVHCTVKVKSKVDSSLILLNLLKKEEPIVPNDPCSGKEKFWISPKNGQGSTCITAKVSQETAHYRVWLDESVSLSSTFLSSYINEIENKHSILTDNLGDFWDINQDGKIDILFSDDIDSFGSILGYVSFYDTFVKSYRYQSNHRDIVYINSIAQNNDSYKKTTIHELQHLFRLKYQIENGKPVVDSLWINEGSSEYMVDLVGYSPQQERIDCFNTFICAPNKNSLFDSKFQGRYSFAYTFVSYIYHNAASSEKQRTSFFYRTTKGEKGVRANNAKGFFNSFKNFADNYDSTLLGNDANSIFQNLYGAFLWNTTYMDKSIKAYSFGKDKTDQFKKVIDKYPMPSLFQNKLKLKKSSSSMDILNPAQLVYTSASIDPNQLKENYFLIYKNRHYLKFNSSLNEGNFDFSLVSQEKCIHYNILNSFTSLNTK